MEGDVTASRRRRVRDSSHPERNHPLPASTADCWLSTITWAADVSLRRKATPDLLAFAIPEGPNQLRAVRLQVLDRQA